MGFNNCNLSHKTLKGRALWSKIMAQQNLVVVVFFSFIYLLFSIGKVGKVQVGWLVL